MALPNQLKATRMSNATAASDVDLYTSAAEQAVIDILGLYPDVDIIAPAFFKHIANQMTVPMVKTTATAGMVATDDTPLRLDMDAEAYDNDTMHVAVPNNHRITCQTAGKYFVIGHVSYEDDDVGLVRLEILKNDVLVARVGSEGQEGAGTVPQSLNISLQLSMAAGDYLSMQFTQSSASSMTVAAPTYLAAHRLGG